MQHQHRKTLYSCHAVIALAILGAVIVALCATPEVAVVIGQVLARMAMAVASTVRT